LRYSVTNFPSRFLEPYRQDSIRTADLKQYVGKQKTLVGHVAASKYIRTKKGDPMCLLNISDEHGMADVVIWPELFKKHHLQLSIAQALKITGKIAENFGVPSLIAETIERLEFQSTD
jgi:DNA polymerase III subunit alpha